MAQNSVNYGNNPTGPELLDDYLDKEQENILTSNSGIQRPSYAVVGTKWLDTSSTPWVWKMFDGMSDIILGSIDPTTHAFTPAGIDTAVLLTGNQTIGGIKTFSNNPLVPNVTSGDSSSKVANTAFVTSVASGLQTQVNTKANDADVVHKTDNETITGQKTFTGQIGIVDNTLSAIKLEIPGVQSVSFNLRYYDNTGVYLTTSDFQSFVPLYVSPSNYINSAVTTLAIGTNYVKLGNGLIIQWGFVSGSGTYNFYIPFASTCVVSLTGSDGSGVNDNNAVTGISITGFTAAVFGSGGAFWMATGF